MNILNTLVRKDTKEIWKKFTFLPPQCLWILYYFVFCVWSRTLQQMQKYKIQKKNASAWPTAPHPSIFSEASGSLCFVFKDGWSRCCTRPSFKGSNNRRQNHRKHCLLQDWLTFRWLDVWLLDKLVNTTFIISWSVPICSCCQGEG